MNYRRLAKQLISIVAILVVVLVVIGGVTARRAYAQGNSGGNGTPAILAAIQVVQNGIVALQASVNALIASGQGNVRVTPPTFFTHVPQTFDVVACAVVNVSNGTRTVDVHLKNSAGVTAANFPFVLAPGAATALSLLSPSSDLYYCTFAVDGGSRTDIRAHLSFRAAAATSDTLTVQAE